MKISRSAILAAVTVATGSAFMSGGRRTILSRATSQSSSFLGHTANTILPSGSKARDGGRGLNMFFGNLFGDLVEPKIDYQNLGFPGSELGEIAKQRKVVTHSADEPKLAMATFAGGCFWGLELAYQRVPGVEYTAVGYTQGPEENPTYGQVCAGNTGHTEAVIVYYDPEECKYETLLDTFFARVDPTTVNGQGRDFGRQYRTGVYTHTPEQMEAAAARFEVEQGKWKKKIATELKQATPFWPAEKYHQQYLEKGGRFGQKQSAEKGSTDTIRCYG